MPLAVHQPRPADPGRPFVTRRFIAAPEGVPVAAVHVVTDMERPDLLGARYLGDPLLYWRIADANAVVDPHELTDTPGRRVVIPGTGS